MAITLIVCSGLSGAIWLPTHHLPNPARLVRADQLAASPASGELAVGANRQKPRTPLFTDASVHDPSVVKVGNIFYVFGSHLAAAKTKDFMQWNKVADGVNSDNSLFDNVVEELKEAFDWAQSRALWAADVIQLKDASTCITTPPKGILHAPRLALPSPTR
jgi:hypothetical protein